MGDRWLLRGAEVITCEPGQEDLPRGDVLVEDGVIVAIGPELRAGDCRVLDLSGKLVMPGLIDTHRHTWQTPLRALGADWTVMDYLAAVRVKLAPAFQPEDIHAANLAGALEALDAGITTLVDYSHCMASPEHADAALTALEEARIRALFAYGYAAGPGECPALPTHASRLQDARRLRTTRLASDGGLVRMGIALTEMQVPWEQSRAELLSARELGVPITAHCSAWPMPGPSEVQRLADAGLLGPDLLFVHCTWSSREDLERIAASGGSIAATPETELQMGMGFPITGQALRAGVRVTLGCDVVSSNGGDLFTAMRLALQVERGRTNERVGMPKALELKAARVLQMVTLDAAEALGLGRVTGSLRPGKDADLLVLSADALNLTPLNRPRDAVVLQAHAGNVESVMVRGRWVKLQGRLVDVDVAAVRRKVTAARDAVLGRVGGPSALLGERGALASHWDTGRGGATEEA
ncbi:amidohydrolase family protein [Myxococcus sp. RHSTA-1-4]|uniref:amidohydrolase family protein n=1 Tax=Myxococcus sp. RHSTA-1-4 TaxID=2874601 RepID=UPI001CBF2420|nr:amidohydrolase family protein [Myxococcus sp. RHSTA-1-4]MBZ4421883.1 amidohydrolase family protein [Myxococcus sp. RHSTA-1-4]